MDCYAMSRTDDRDAIREFRGFWENLGFSKTTVFGRRGLWGDRADQPDQWVVGTVRVDGRARDATFPLQVQSHPGGWRVRVFHFITPRKRILRSLLTCMSVPAFGGYNIPFNSLWVVSKGRILRS